MSQSAPLDELLNSSNLKRKRDIDEDPAPEPRDKTAGPLQSQPQLGAGRLCSTDKGGDQQSALNSLCRQCAKLPLRAIFSDKKLEEDGKILLTGFKPAGTWTETLCPLCRILGATLPPGAREDPEEGWELYAYSNAHCRKPWTTMEASVMLQLSTSNVPHDAFVVHHWKNSPTVRHLASDQIDYSLLKGWMTFCEQNHRRSCRKRGPDVPFLRLIDCQSRKLVPAERHPYAALSYLWGKPGESTASQNDTEACREELPSFLPATIQDAILVTKNLGLRYLWIDRYCINQKEKREVDEQIRQMDLVYQNAEVTIIAAAGNDPSHGLPGVQSRSRRPQCRVEIDDYVLVQSLLNPQLAILQSAWWTRGWTFQEGLLARRRLVFTDEQVYYECGSMYCCEALNVTLDRLDDLHTKGTKMFKKKYSVGSSYINLHLGTLGAFPGGVIGRDVGETVKFISDYSCRRFTEPGDRLKGFQGVLRAMYATHGVQHFWGIPIIPRKPASRRAAERLPSKNPPVSFLAGLSWKMVRPAKRIRSLPSWSWVGWEGIVYIGWGASAYRDDGSLWSDPDVEINFMDQYGQILGWESFQNEYRHVNKVQTLSPYIQITTWIAKATVVKQSPNPASHSVYFVSDSVYEATVETANSEPVDWTFVPDTQRPLKNGHTYTCLYIGLYSDCPTEGWGVDVLIVDEVDEPQGCYERIGAGFLRVLPELRFPNDDLQRARFEDEIARTRHFRPCAAIWNERATITLR